MKVIYGITMVVYIIALYLGVQYNASMGEGLYWLCWKYTLVRFGVNNGLCLTSATLIFSIIIAVTNGWKVDKDIFWSWLSAKGVPLGLWIIVTGFATFVDLTGVMPPMGSNGGSDFWNSGYSHSIKETQVVQDAEKVLPDYLVPDTIGVPSPANWWHRILGLVVLSFLLSLFGWSITGTAWKGVKGVGGEFKKKDTWVFLGILLLTISILLGLGYVWFILGLEDIFPSKTSGQSFGLFIALCICFFGIGWWWWWMKKNKMLDEDPPKN